MTTEVGPARTATELDNEIQCDAKQTFSGWLRTVFEVKSVTSVPPSRLRKDGGEEVKSKEREECYGGIVGLAKTGAKAEESLRGGTREVEGWSSRE